MPRSKFLSDRGRNHVGRNANDKDMFAQADQKIKNKTRTFGALWWKA
jgi:hypothetical protein